MSHQWLAAVGAVVLVLVASAPFVASDRQQPAPGAEVVERGRTADGVAAEPWDRARRESAEAIDALGDAGRTSMRDAWEATREGTGAAVDATREGTTRAWNRIEDAGESAWEATRDATVRGWQATRDAAAGLWRRVDPRDPDDGTG